MDERIRLIATDVQAKLISDGDSFGLYDLYNENDLDKAVTEKKRVYVIDEETGNPGEMIFDGENWLTDRPVFVRDEAQDITIATANYVEALAEVIQSEIEAVAEAVEPSTAATVSTLNPVKTLREKIADARIAMQKQDPVMMVEAAQALSPQKHELYTMAQAEEMASGPTT